MDRSKYDRIIALFRPDEKWRNWPHIDEYLNAIDAWLAEHTLTDEQIIRYMLAGFYTDYRAANHLGCDLQTLPERWALDHRPHNREQEKVVTSNRVFGRPITDSLDYLGIITGTTHHDFDWFAQGFFAFVLAGHGQPSPL